MCVWEPWSLPPGFTTMWQPSTSTLISGAWTMSSRGSSSWTIGWWGIIQKKRWTRIPRFAGESNCHAGFSGRVARMARGLLCHLLQWVHCHLLWEGLLHCVEQECPGGQVLIYKCKCGRVDVPFWICAPNIYFAGGRSILLTPLSPPPLAGKRLHFIGSLFMNGLFRQVLCALLPTPLLPGLPTSWMEPLLAGLSGQMGSLLLFESHE